jgi:DGQHR domain-containing protein
MFDYMKFNDQSALATMPAENLNNLSVVSIMDADPKSPSKKGLQRMLNRTRVPHIARYYLRNGNGAHITPLVIWARLTDKQMDEFSKHWEKGNLAVIIEKWGTDVLTILDGQHRTAGLQLAWEESKGKFNPSVPIQFMWGLTYDEAAQIFLDINGNGKNVPTATQEIIKATITSRNDVDHAQWARTTAQHLDDNPGSAWYKTFDLPGCGTPKKETYMQARLTMAAVPRGLLSLIPEKTTKRYLKAAGIDPQGMAMHYWGCVRNVTGEAWDYYPVTDKKTKHVTHSPTRLKDIAGYGALSMLGAVLINQALQGETNELKVQARLRGSMERLADVDWRLADDNPWMYGVGAGWAGASILFHRLRDYVQFGITP